MKKQKYVYNSVGWWLNRLPTSARMKARRNSTRLLSSKVKAGSLSGVLHGLFNWDKSPEGYGYWSLIDLKYGNQR